MVENLSAVNYGIRLALDEYEHYLDLQDRRLYLMNEIETESCGYGMSMSQQLADDILAINRLDHGLEAASRKPIRLYINSPGGEVTAGFSIVSAIEASTTPVYTVNIGQWSSMAFLIGITGHKRFSLPYMTFLMHEGTNFVFGSTNKAQDKMKFDERFEIEVIKRHVLKHSNMKPTDYDALARVEYYMLPEDALERGFIDQIVTSLDDIL